MKIVFLLVALGAVILVACSSTTKSATTVIHQQDAAENGRLRGVPISGVLERIDQEAAQTIRIALDNVPDPLPPYAVSLVKVLLGTTKSPAGQTVETPQDGVVRNRLVVADPGSNSTDIGLLCFINFLPAACSPAAKTWHLDLPPSTVVEAPIQMSAQVGDTIDFVLLVAGDDKRPQAASTDLHISVGSLGKTPVPVPRAAQQHARVYGGCGFAAITTDDTPQEILHRHPRPSTSERLFLVVQPCEASGPEDAIQAVAVFNRTTVAPFPGLEAPTLISGGALVVPLPKEIRRVGSDLQVVVFRQRSKAWITTPLRFVA